MNILFKQFTTRYVNLNSSLDAAALEAEMLKFCGRGFWDFSVNMRGRVTDDGEYSFWRRWQIGAMNTGGMPKLWARVLPGVNGSVVEVRMPVPFGSVFGAIVFSLFGLVFLCVGLFGSHLDEAPIIMGLAFMIIPVAGTAYQNNWSRSKLLATFAAEFDLYQG